MKSKQVILVSICGVGVILFALAGFLLVRGFVNFSGAIEKFNKEKQALGHYYQKNPFPSEANIRLEEDNAQMLNAWHEQLFKRLIAKNVVSTEDSGSRFRQNYDETKKRLLGAAKDVQIAGGNTFAFGFDRYSGTGELPQSSEVPVLMEQLAIVERLCGILFENGIKAMGAVRRDVVESASTTGGSVTVPGGQPGVGSAPPGRPVRSGAPVGPAPLVPPKARRKAVPGDEPTEPMRPVGKMYSRLHFGFDFRAKESALLGILNAMASNDMFIVMTSISFEAGVPEMMPVAVPVVSGGDAAAIPALPPAPVPAVGAPAETGNVPQAWERRKDERIVSGPVHEIPMDVTLELDVYKFQPESHHGD